jgi:DNA replication and repair protein RecF
LFNERVSKNFCSQGQCRSIVLSLKLASVNCIEKNHKEKMIFLIDDAVSELDTLRTSRVLPMLEMKGQIFLALPELDNNLLKDFRRLRIDKGAIVIQ